MLRCAILRRVTRDPQSSCRKALLYQESLIVRPRHQIRSLGFLPIVSSHDVAKKEPSCNTGLGTSSDHINTPEKIGTASGNAGNQHIVRTDTNIDELAKVPSSSTDEPIVSNPRFGEAVESANTSDIHLQRDEQLSQKRGPQSATESGACSNKSNVCESDAAQQAKRSLSSTSESMKKPFSITLTDGSIISFSGKQVIDQNTLRIIQAFWEDFKATGPFDDTQEAVLILRTDQTHNIVLFVWERITPDIRYSPNPYTCSLNVRVDPTGRSYASYTCVRQVGLRNARRARNEVFVPSLFNHLGREDQSTSLLASESRVHPCARELQQEYSDVPAEKTPGYLLQLCDPEAPPTQDSDGESRQDSTASGPQIHPSIETSPSVADADSNGGLAAMTTQFSASLADGTIVHLHDSLINLSEFKDLVLTISKIWKQYSDEIIPHLSAQTIGIAIHRGVEHDPDLRQDVLHTKIFDAGRSFTVFIGRTGLQSALVQALKNHIGSVDKHGSLVVHSSPVTHALSFNHQQHEECFMYELGNHKSEPLSIVLDENTIVTPVPASITAVTRETLLSLAVPIWQWWRRERPSVRKDQHGIITNIRIIESHPTKSFLRMEVWKMSLIPDVSLSRSVHKLFTSDTNGSFKSSIGESSHEFENLRYGNDFSLRQNAMMFLKTTIGWIDSSGNLIEGEYPKLKSLVNSIKGESPSSVDSEYFFSLKKSASPGPQTILDGENPKLDQGHVEEAVAVSSSNKKDTEGRDLCMPAVLHDGSLVVPSSKLRYNLKKGVGSVSATLRDGTLVIFSFRLCRQMSQGHGEELIVILQVIAQWREQARDELKQGQHETASMLYVFPKRSSTSVEIEVVCKRYDWCEQPRTQYKLHHTLPSPSCTYVSFETICDSRDHSTWWNDNLLRTFKSGLKNHIAAMDEKGTLRISEQPAINQFFYELQEPTNLNLAASTEIKESPREKYTPLSPIDTIPAEKGREQAPEVSRYDQIENVMKLAGDLYDVSTMLNEEISNAPSHPNGSPVRDHVDSSWLNEPNPVLKTRKHGQINIDAVKGAISLLKARLRDHEDKAHILAHLCKRWKGELEVEHPLMNRESVSQSGVHNLAIPRSGPSKPEGPVTEKKTSADPQEPAKSPKIRYMHSPDRKYDDDDGFSIFAI